MCYCARAQRANHLFFDLIRSLLEYARGGPVQAGVDLKMTEDEKILQILNSSKTHEEVLHSLHAFVKELRKEGNSSEAILFRMRELRNSVPNEQDDILLEVMDC